MKKPSTPKGRRRGLDKQMRDFAIVALAEVFKSDELGDLFGVSKKHVESILSSNFLTRSWELQYKLMQDRTMVLAIAWRALRSHLSGVSESGRVLLQPEDVEALASDLRAIGSRKPRP